MLAAAIRSNERGEMVIRFDKEGIPPHDLYLFYRWVPTDKNYSGRLLVMTGVSKYSINTKINDWISYGAIALIIVSAIFIISTVMLIYRLGYINKEVGETWKNKISS